MNINNKNVIWALPIALLALVASFLLWTSFLTGSHPVGVETARAEDSSFIPSNLTVHPSSDELSEWGLHNAWTVEVPSLGITAPVYLPSRRYWDRQQWTLLEEQMQIGMSEGAVAYPHSVEPGERGSVFIAGHSSPPNERAKNSEYGTVFAKLPDISVGASIILHTENGAMEYLVEDTKVISPKETELLAQEYRSNQLKLITCFPIGTTKDRFVVIAKMKKKQ